jgi:wobble nucleotide-excising tRNase
MFLKKIIKIQNIGKFHKGGVSGGEYGKFTLFYAGNGRGKTTLCAVLRSMKTGMATIIEDRRTLGETVTPEAQLLLDTGVATFSNNKWKNGGTALHIFDGAFVTTNVHAGEEVNTDHRRSIYRVILGAKGVQLAEEVDGLDAKITDITSKIATEKKALQQHVAAGITFEKFLGSAEDPEIDNKIANQKTKIKAAEQAADIVAKPLLKPPPIPSLSDSFVPTLGKTIAGVSADAAKRLEAHLLKHKFSGDGEVWIATGLQHVHDDACPFCANNVESNPLVDLYREYFDEAYEAFKSELVTLQKEVAGGLSEAAGLKVKSRFADVAKDVEFWRAFGTIEFTSAPSLDAMLGKLAILYTEAKRAIEAKIAAPLEVIEISELQKAISEWLPIQDELSACNSSLTLVNSGIQAIKTGTASVNKAALETVLKELEAIKKRHAPEVKLLADTYNALTAEKSKLVAEKHKKKEELGAYDATVLPRYHDAINRYLAQFGAGFSLMRSEKNYVGKVPQWIYTIEINKHPVDVTKKAGQGEPSFQTAMSAGDRSTLALALFLAQLDLDPSLKESVVAFDDPFTSLDDFRRAMTAKTIFRVGQTASQVLVFSHDKHFLKAVSDVVIDTKCETFQISSIKKNSSIEAWDLEREVKEGYLQDHMVLKDFYEGYGGDPKAMRTLMRPILEKYIRYRFPNQIPDGKWLGDMLAIVASDPKHPLTPLYQDLDDINQYTAPFHHDPNSAFSDDEVKSYVGRTLAIVGGC